MLVGGILHNVARGGMHGIIKDRKVVFLVILAVKHMDAVMRKCLKLVAIEKSG